jgi:hypothetical protein
MSVDCLYGHARARARVRARVRAHVRAHVRTRAYTRACLAPAPARRWCSQYFTRILRASAE